MNRRRADEEIGALNRRLRRLTERNRIEFDLGFAAAIRMLEAGATIERLKEAQCVPMTQPDADTLPVDEPDTDVHVLEF